MDPNKLTDAFQDLQTQLQTQMTSRQKLETQFQENKIVLEEFETLADDAKVYKLIGPVLLPQELAEAKINVEKRIEFIQKEIQGVEDNVDKTKKEMTNVRNKLVEARTQMWDQKEGAINGSTSG